MNEKYKNQTTSVHNTYNINKMQSAVVQQLTCNGLG